MKEICLVFEAFLVFVFLSPDITNSYKLFMGSNSIFELSTMHSTFRLTRQMPQRELRSEPDLTLLKHLNFISVWEDLSQSPWSFCQVTARGKPADASPTFRFFLKSRKHMRPNSSFARNSSLRLELFFKTVMWQDKTNENILNECFVNVIMAVER